MTRRFSPAETYALDVPDGAVESVDGQQCVDLGSASIGIGDAPETGTGYVRKDGQWVPESGGGPVGSYANTFFVDPNGDPLVDGKNPAAPTTLANALAQLAFSSALVISEGTYNDAVTNPPANVTLHSWQAGSGSNSVILTGDVTLSNARFRAFGIRFDGSITDSGPGSHFFGWCSSAGSTFDRSAASGFVVVSDCDFSAVSFVKAGSSTGLLALRGAGTTFGTVSVTSTAVNSVLVDSAGSCGRVTMSGAAHVLTGRKTVFVDASLGLDLAAGTTANLFNTQVQNLAGVPVPITVDALAPDDLVYEPSGSTVGSVAGNPTAFAEVRYAPSTPGDYSPAVGGVFAALDQLAARKPPQYYSFARGGNAGSAGVPLAPAGGGNNGVGFVARVAGTIIEWGYALTSGSVTLIGLEIVVVAPGGAQTPTLVQGAAVGFGGNDKAASGTTSVAVPAGSIVRASTNNDNNGSNHVAWLRFQPT